MINRILILVGVVGLIVWAVAMFRGKPNGKLRINSGWKSSDRVITKKDIEEADEIHLR